MNDWISVKDLLPEPNLPIELRHKLCYCPGINGTMPGKDWMDSNYCIGEYVRKGILGDTCWKRVDNENIQVTHWMNIPIPPTQF